MSQPEQVASEQVTAEQIPLEDALYQELHSVPVGRGNRSAKEGYVFRCRHCGKRARDMYGDIAIDPGYDESCMLNSELVKV